MEDDTRDDRHLALQIDGLEWQVHDQQLEDRVQENTTSDHQDQMWRPVLDVWLVSIPADHAHDEAEEQDGYDQ